MFFRTQRTLSENILMIFDPLPVKFLPQKNCWFGPKIAIFSVVNCPGAKNGVIKNFCCTKKWPRRGQKIKKKFFFRKNIRKMGKTNFGTSGTIITQNRFFQHVSDANPYPSTGPSHGHFPFWGGFVATRLWPADLFWDDFSKLLQMFPNVICGSYKCLEDSNMF